MSEGIKETKDVMIAFLKLSALLAVTFKDGAQAKDFIEVYEKISSNEELKASFVAAYNDIEKVPAEVKDLQFAEAVELLVAAVPEIANLIKAI